MSDRALRLAIAAVALAGTAVAGYLTYVHYRPAALVCTGGGGCEAVQESSYAELAGIPVALLGFAAYLVAVQAFAIEEWCIWCLVNDLVVVPLLAGLTVWRVARPRPG